MKDDQVKNERYLASVSVFPTFHTVRGTLLSKEVFSRLLAFTIEATQAWPSDPACVKERFEWLFVVAKGALRAGGDPESLAPAGEKMRIRKRGFSQVIGPLDSLPVNLASPSALRVTG